MLQMTSGEIGAFLERQETGVLSLCSDGDAYGVPESFGYLDGTLYFELEHHPESRKLAYLEETETVSFTVHEANAADDFASVVVRGSLVETDAETASVALGRNEQFPSSGVFPEYGDGSTLATYELVAEEVTGRKGDAFELEESLAKPKRPGEKAE